MQDDHRNIVYDLIIAGGGASGFFAAIEVASLKPELSILILEKSTKVLSKVKISGGGRCNVTHNCENGFELARHYPRGEKQMKNLFRQFNASDMVRWLERRNVMLHAENDGRMFPTTNNSQTIIDCFVNEANRLKVKMNLGTAIDSILKQDAHITIYTNQSTKLFCRSLLIAVGGSSKSEFYKWIKNTEVEIKSPRPSLFTFNDPKKSFSDLMGLSVALGEIRIEGTKFKQKGPILITHWGFSGPAVIKLSAWAAEYLYERNYNFTIQINWTGTMNETNIQDFFESQRKNKGKQKIKTNPQFSIPSRLWERLCEKAEISDDKIWAEVTNRHLNKLQENLIRCSVVIEGKTTFKEEFVTCGGVDLNEVDLNTMESKKTRGIFFAGEVLDIDGETGGFNFQVAWTTAFAAARGIVKYLDNGK